MYIYIYIYYVCDARWLRLANYPAELDSEYYVIFSHVNCTASVMPPSVLSTDAHLAYICLSEHRIIAGVRGDRSCCARVAYLG